MTSDDVHSNTGGQAFNVLMHRQAHHASSESVGVNPGLSKNLTTFLHEQSRTSGGLRLTEGRAPQVR
jgi:hypothetical protein